MAKKKLEEVSEENEVKNSKLKDLKSKIDAKKKDLPILGIKNLKGEFRRASEVISQGCVSTGHSQLDLAIKYGVHLADVDLSKLDGYDPKEQLGLPFGKMVEFYGEEGSGKSSLAYRIAGNAQKMGHNVAWIDTEFSFSESLADINGVDLDNLALSDNPKPAEDVLDDLYHLCASGQYKVIVLDSVASLVPKTRMEKDAEQMTVGVLARLLTDNLGKIAGEAQKNGVLVIFINQLRDKIGVMFGPTDTSPGGRALKHMCSLRLIVSKQLAKAANIQVQDSEGVTRVVGKKSNVRFAKNRFGRPMPPDAPSVEITIFYESYFPDIEELMYTFGRELQVVKVRTGIFSWGDVKIEGKAQFIKHIKENDLQSQLYIDLINEAQENNKIVPPEITNWGVEHFDERKVKNVKKSQTEDSST